MSHPTFGAGVIEAVTPERHIIVRYAAGVFGTLAQDADILTAQTCPNQRQGCPVRIPD